MMAKGVDSQGLVLFIADPDDKFSGEGVDPIKIMFFQ